MTSRSRGRTSPLRTFEAIVVDQNHGEITVAPMPYVRKFTHYFGGSGPAYEFVIHQWTDGQWACSHLQSGQRLCTVPEGPVVDQVLYARQWADEKFARLAGGHQQLAEAMKKAEARRIELSRK
ncbi:TPA: hypothetical protein ACMFQN_005210 [Pseudomonas aeruginosa]